MLNMPGQIFRKPFYLSFTIVNQDSACWQTKKTLDSLIAKTGDPIQNLSDQHTPASRGEQGGNGYVRQHITWPISYQKTQNGPREQWRY